MSSSSAAVSRNFLYYHLPLLSETCSTIIDFHCCHHLLLLRLVMSSSDTAAIIYHCFQQIPLLTLSTTASGEYLYSYYKPLLRANISDAIIYLCLV
ncbi:hypothetical protein CDAR_596481 [Caerostris darwini]|uniref:Uncharacterized protein n=1 Tax=Caerostris darwini TaxID=1538125 RepID=A0AAV4U8A0_9ARAC|nr:hypothetical protein CDAR_596481 [Caerostris darwini]